SLWDSGAILVERPRIFASACLEISRTRRRIRLIIGAMKNPTGAGVAVLIPCYNEAKTIGAVVRDFRRALPKAEILVFDNHSSDATAAEASAAGAVVREVSRRGKGNVVRRMFADVEADVYLMVDGDGTYDAATASTLVQRLSAGGLDMVVGSRVDEHPQ